MEKNLIKEVSNSLNFMMSSHRDLRNDFNDLKITPKNHFLIPFHREGESFYTLENGYVMKVSVQFEHRAVAENILCRELASHEVVHHIFGPARDNNSPQNLCVLDRDEHDLFHSYIDRELRVKGKYPTISFQRHLLKTKFRGLLLDEAQAKKQSTHEPIAPFKDIPEEVT